MADVYIRRKDTKLDISVGWNAYKVSLLKYKTNTDLNALLSFPSNELLGRPKHFSGLPYLACRPFSSFRTMQHCEYTLFKEWKLCDDGEWR